MAICGLRLIPHACSSPVPVHGDVNKLTLVKGNVSLEQPIPEALT